jgi:predicted nucleic acid-binding protein
MKVSEMIGTRVDPRGVIEFDVAERDRYVSRFLAAFNADVEDDEKARLVFEVHRSLGGKHDLYIAVHDQLTWWHKNALHVYVTRLWKSF